MPALIAVPALIAAGASMYGASQQNKASKYAAQSQTQANTEALNWEREQDTLDRAQYAQTEALNKQRWDIEADREENRYVTTRGDSLRGEARDLDMWNSIQRNRQPYRNIGVAAAQDLARRAGLNVSDQTAYQLANNVPANVTPATMASLLAKSGQTTNTTRSA